MKKKLRQWVKLEKRIIRLMYRKGILTGDVFEIKDLYWAGYTGVNPQKYNGQYLPEVHFCTSDYWGECDEYSVVSVALSEWYWEQKSCDPDCGEDCDKDCDDWPESAFNLRVRQRRQIIKYLTGLKTKKTDSEINRVLKMRRFK